MEFNDPVMDRNDRDDLAWSVIRGAADVAATICAANGRHDWAIALTCLVTQAEMVRVASRRRRRRQCSRKFGFRPVWPSDVEE